MSLVKSYEGGRESHARVIVQSLFEEYLSVEELFSDKIQVIGLSDDNFCSAKNYQVANISLTGSDYKLLYGKMNKKLPFGTIFSN